MQLIGLARLGQDIEIRAVGDSTAGRLSLAFTYYKKGAEKNRATQWVEGTLWGDRAESLADYLVRGQQVVVTLDDVHIEEYPKRDGGTGTKLVGKVSNIELAGGRPDGQAASPAPRPAARAPAPRAAPTAAGFDNMDDDIPF